MHCKSARRRVVLYYDRLLFPAGTILTAPPLFSTQCPPRLCLADNSPCVTDGMQGNQQDCTVNVNRDSFRFLATVDNGGLQDSVQQCFIRKFYPLALLGQSKLNQKQRTDMSTLTLFKATLQPNSFFLVNVP